MYESFAQLGGHPVHPMLIVFPIGLFLTSLLFDIIYALRRDVFWHRAAYYTMWVGFIGGVSAAIPGFLDYLKAIPKNADPHHDAVIHGWLNASVLTIFLVNLLIRTWRRTEAGPLLGITGALSVLGVLLLTISGWYGGEMVYRDGVGVHPEEEAEKGRESSRFDGIIRIAPVQPAQSVTDRWAGPQSPG